MMKFSIVEREKADANVVKLVDEVWAKITPHWQKRFPKIKVVIAQQTLDKIPAIKKWARGIEREAKKRGGEAFLKYWDAACVSAKDGTPIIYVHLRSSLGSNEYYFQKSIYGVLAKNIWVNSPKLQKKVIELTPWLGPYGAYISFRDSFSRFFLNPRWLKEDRAEAWHFMKTLDSFLANSK